ncbi:hypothetical protein MCOR27_002782 [Pyricularia oryzae]|uniref:BZIP domain-containing protein n=2 Tax=Pyricularia TaxID=48558 RepID=A0ABQ8N6U7_PYRGI|nr:hypothetical protein MCOR01_000047 [Pyricularia oryzae]KAI6291754.1 hypothetical protein MCOR33_010376 [Pyricularia grisea]KAH9428251.1 hypothetical protein MCOR02_011736 [Pyricularia oryzae]KAI6260080.1 hypothetical protein MCOR19_003599 [Pyricularia oryzae]KAI6284427.1 hypothetical protein MCOR27_002782 [Pyricularia oryzae]
MGCTPSKEYPNVTPETASPSLERRKAGMKAREVNAQRKLQATRERRAQNKQERDERVAKEGGRRRRHNGVYAFGGADGGGGGSCGG